MITRQESKQIVEFVLGEIKKRSFTYATDAKFDFNKHTVGQVDNNQIAASAVDEFKIADDAVTDQKIIDGAVIESKIATSAIIAEKIASDAVIERTILDSAISTAKLATGAVTSAKTTLSGIDPTTGRIKINDLIDANNITGGINDYADTLIAAQKVLIYGSTTLSGWAHYEDLTYIDGGKIYTGSISMTSVSGTLDDIEDGATWGKVAKTDISAGHILLSSVTQDSSYRTVTDTQMAQWDSYATSGGLVMYYQDLEPASGMSDGDMWVDTDDGNKFYVYASGAWQDAQDDDIAQALVNAATAQATADGKVFTFAQDAEPTASGIGDLWIDTNDKNKLYRWSGISWVSVRDSDINQAILDAADAQSTADGKITSFYQTTAPSSGMGDGDFWIDTDDGNKIYIYDSGWTDAQDTGIAQAISDAAGAQATADGKIFTFYQDSTPTASGVGDLWIDTDDKNKLYRWNGGSWISARDTDIQQALDDAAAAQTTADGRILLFYQSSEPASGMSNGDIWVDTDDNKMYVYYSSTWNDAQDNDVAIALSDAADAQATADGKVVTFFQDSSPTASGIGDLWIDTNDKNTLYRWNGATWDSARDTDIAQAIQDASDAQATADGKITSFYQTTAPASGMAEGDFWIDTDGGNKLYVYHSSSWYDAQDDDIAQAIQDAAGAQATADGKIFTFYQDSEPTASGVGDLWVDTDDKNKLYRWGGASWVTIRDTDIQQALDDASAAQSTADGKINTFYQASAPSGAGESDGDIWVDTDDGNKFYVYSGGWQDAQDSAIATALTDAATAQATADGKVVTFFQDSSPTASGVGDLWVDTDASNKLYRWDGSWTEVVWNLDNVDNGATYGKVAITDIGEGHILLATCSGNLDDIENGTNWGKVALTSIQDGKILVAGLNSDVTERIFTASGINTNIEGWQHSSDATYIDGGRIYANSVLANSLTVSPGNFLDDPSFERSEAYSGSSDFVGWEAGVNSIWFTMADTQNHSAVSGMAYVVSGDLGPMYQENFLYSNFVRCNYGDIFQASAWVKCTNIYDIYSDFRLYLEFYAEDKETLLDSSYTEVVKSTTWTYYSVEDTAPAGASYARMAFDVVAGIEGSSYYWFADDCNLTKSSQIIVHGTPGGTRTEMNSDGFYAYSGSTPTFYVKAEDGFAYCGGGVIQFGPDGLIVQEDDDTSGSSRIIFKNDAGNTICHMRTYSSGDGFGIYNNFQADIVVEAADATLNLRGGQANLISYNDNLELWSWGSGYMYLISLGDIRLNAADYIKLIGLPTSNPTVTNAIYRDGSADGAAIRISNG